MSIFWILYFGDHFVACVMCTSNIVSEGYRLVVLFINVWYNI